MNQKHIGVLLSYGTEAVKILSALLYTPFMLKLLGPSEYGLYQLTISVVSYLSLLSLGFQGAYVRYFSRYKASRDEEGLKRFNGMFLTIFLIMALVSGLCGLVMILNLRHIFGGNFTQSEYQKAHILMSLMVFNVSLSFPCSVFECMIIAHERFLFLKLVSFLRALLNPLIAFPLMLMGYKSVIVVLVSTGVTASALIADMSYCLRGLRVGFSFGHFSGGLFWDVSRFTVFLFLNQVIDQINWNVDRFLLGRMIGTAEVALYSVAAMLNALYIQSSTAISSVFVPQVNRVVAESDDNDILTGIMIRVGRVQLAVLGLLLTGIIFMGRTFVILWTGPEYAEAYVVALILIVPVTIPLLQNIGIEIQTAKYMHKARSLVYFFMAFANLLISIPLVRLYRSAGAAMGTAISLTLANILFMNFYYHYRVGLNMVRFWKSLLSMLPSMIAPIGAGILITRYAGIESWGTLMLGGATYALVYGLSVFHFGLTREERRQAVRLLQRFSPKSK